MKKIGIKRTMIIATLTLAGFLLMAVAAAAQTFPSSPRPFYPPAPSGPLPYKPIAPPPPQTAPSGLPAPTTGKKESGVVNPWTGEFYPGTFGGVINPRTGVVLPKVEGGYLNPQTGEIIPKKE